MSPQPALTPLHDDPGQPADAHGYREVLHDLITMGTGFARLLHSQATAQAQAAQPAAPARTDPPPAPDALISLAAAFDRTARAVRRGILLARSLDQPVPSAPDPAQPRAAARRRIIREVEDAIQRTGSRASDGRDGAEALHAELRDRLDAPDLDDDLGTRPAADIIAEICRDLGLAAPQGARAWKRRTPEDIAQLCARAAAPSAARQPDNGPQPPRRDATPRSLDPQPDKRASVPSAQPGPIRSGSGPAADPAKTIDMLLRHPARLRGRWHRPPEG